MQGKHAVQWHWNSDVKNHPSYFNWKTGEPNVDPSRVNYVKMSPDGTWFVPDDASPDYYICQSPKIPLLHIVTDTVTTAESMIITIFESFNHLRNLL